MTGRFPGAESVEQFWKNLCEGVESITFFDRSELEPSERVIADRNETYVPARPLLKNPDLFDASSSASIQGSRADGPAAPHSARMRVEVLERADTIRTTSRNPLECSRVAA